MWGYDHMWGMHWGWWIFWIILILGFVWVLVNSRSDRSRSEEPRETALDVLQRRYASGEISSEEYKERKSFLEQDRQ